MTAFEAFATHLVDYAGLFPPSKLDMRAAVANYLAYRGGELAWMLGPFICPVGRLAEFGEALAAADTSTVKPPVALSVIPDNNIASSLETIFDFEDAHEGAIVVPAIEAKVSAVSEIENIDSRMPESMRAAIEIPLNEDFRGLITAIAGTGHAAKIRTGGVEPSAFPTVETVAQFISTCYQANVPFKATAGLHNALRHYDESIGCMMHGFFNVFGAAIACRAHQLDTAEVRRILECEDAGEFQITEGAMIVCGHEVESDHIADNRANFALSYGSCSFEDPVDDLKALGLIEMTTPIE